jgi:hypothetical protein
MNNLLIETGLAILVTVIFDGLLRYKVPARKALVILLLFVALPWALVYQFVLPEKTSEMDLLFIAVLFSNLLTRLIEACVYNQRLNTREKIGLVIASVLFFWGASCFWYNLFSVKLNVILKLVFVISIIESGYYLLKYRHRLEL